MLSGGLPAAPTLLSWQSRITVGGEVVDAVLYEVDRSLVNLPGTDNSSGGDGRSARGKLIPSIEKGVLSKARSPWTRLAQWPPRKGTPIVIEESADAGTTWIKVFDGLADKPSGDTSGALEVQLVERVDRFTRLIRQPAMQEVMFPSTAGGDWRDIGLHHMWFIDKAFEQAGYYTTAPPLASPKLKVSMQGSMWPDIGSLVDSAYTHSGSASNTGAEWGRSVQDFTARYAFNKVTQFQGRFFFPVDGSTGVISIDFYDTGGTVQARLKFDAGARYATLQVGSGTPVTVAQLANCGLVVIVRGEGTQWKIASEGATVNGTAAAAFPPIAGMGINAPASGRVGAFTIGEGYGNVDPPATWTPTATIGGAPHLTPLDASPLVWDVQAGTLLDKIGASTCSHWGIREDGTAVFFPTLNYLTAGAARTLTDSADTYGPIGWSQDWQSAASQVRAEFKMPVISRNRYPVIELWRGSGQQISPGDTITDIIHPDADVDWVNVHLGYGVATAFNPAGDQAALGRGTVFIGMVDVSGTDNRVCTTSEYSASLSEVDPASYRLSQSAIGTVTIQTKSGDDSSWVWLPWSQRNADFPVVRGMARTDWVDGSIQTSDDGTDAPVFTLTADEWIGEHGDLIVSGIASIMTADRVALADMEIRPDPRLQLGDRISLQISTLGVTLLCLITGKKLTHDASGLGMTLSVLVTSVDLGGQSWAQVQDAFASNTWAQVQTTYSGQTWSQVQGTWS